MVAFSRLIPSAIVAFAWYASANEDLLVFQSGKSPYKLADQNNAPNIWIAENDFKGVQRVANDLAADFGRVVGKNGTVGLLDSPDHHKSSNGPVVIAGTIGNSTLIDRLIKDRKINVSKVEGKWEAYISQVVTHPVKGVEWALVIAGSDQRGTIYGLYDISERMGVSPWYWWADVPVKTKEAVWVQNGPKVQDSPSVKYRGFFINDENPALSGWADGKFTKSKYGSSFTGEFYKLVFELCLRLKGNYIWPAMWSSMFYVDDPLNGQIANDYGVVMGTSHHEPMARAGNEQGKFMQGVWDWDQNREAVTNFMEEGVKRSSHWETLYTMGMRGSGDAQNPDLNAATLEEIIKVQQSLLKEGLKVSDVASVPQTWVLYKEVGKYYQAGMNVPDSITLLWTDDNSGNIMRVPLANETKHSAGAGVYYHFDYVGVPRDYKWINSIQLVKTWEQMHLAYNKGAQEIWIANVGDIKPLEIPLSHFMDMAYDMSKYTTPEATTDWIKRWATQSFGSSVADRTAEILNTYGLLIMRRKYELLSGNSVFPFSTANYDEAERILNDWEALLELTQRTYDTLDDQTQISYFQTILHPVLAGKTVVELWIKWALNGWRAKQLRVSANELANEVHRLFDKDADITSQYNALNGGKWNHFVDQVHIGYTSWGDPPENKNIMPNVTYLSESDVPKSGIMGVSIQGSTDSAPNGKVLNLLSVDPYTAPGQIRYLDVYARENGTFSYEIKANASYVTVSHSTGTLIAPGDKSDARCVISVDWNKAPKGLSWVSLNVSNAAKGGSVVTALLPVNKTAVPRGFHGYVESNGVVSIEAEHFNNAERKKGISYVTVPYYGRTLSGIKLWPVTAASQTPSSGPKLTYSFHTFTSTDKARVVIYLGASLNHDPSRPLKFAFSIDGSESVTVQPVPDTPMGSTPSGWTNAVVGGGWTSYSTVDLPQGSHELSLWLLEPGVVVQKVAIDVGGLKTSALGPPESKNV